MITSFFFLWQRKKDKLKTPKAGHRLALGVYKYVQKEVISKLKQPSCKKKSTAPQKAMVKKDVKSKVAAKK